MELFVKRPLAFFCFLFLAVSFLAGFLSLPFLILLMVLLLAGAVVLFAVRKFRQRVFGIALGLAVAFLSLCHSFLLTELPFLRAERYEGRRLVLCEVLEEGRDTAYSSLATVRLALVDGESVSIKGELRCDFPIDLSVGDQIYAYAEVSKYEGYGVLASLEGGSEILLSIYADNEEECMIRRLSELETDLSLLSHPTGIRILIHRIREGLSDRLNGLLGEKIGGMANGVLTGDTSGIETETMMHFRRSGVVHLLSVSGLHLAILLGAIEWFLRSLLIPKRVRIPIVSLLSLGILILSGFSPSACRSVLMMLSVYLQFMLAEDSDGVTALFSSVALIVFFSPYSVYDLGLWMSFLATLGLLTVYPLWENTLRRIPVRKGLKGALARFGRKILGGILLTVSANLFLLPILWVAFGELSLVGLLCNVCVSFLSALFLVCIPILLLVGGIPFAGALIALLVRLLGSALLGIIEVFSKIPYGVISLRYTFASVIVILLSIAVFLLLLLRVRRKWLFAAAPSVAAGAFALCLLIGMLFFSRSEAVYLRASSGEAVALKRDQRLVVCDLSSGGWQGTQNVLTLYDGSVATEVEALVLTHLHEGHLSMVEHLSERVILRCVAVPMPKDREERQIASRLSALAEERGIQIGAYETRKGMKVFSGLAIYVEQIRNEQHDAVALMIRGEEEGMIYLSSDFRSSFPSETVAERLSDYETVIFGCHGGEGKEHVTYRMPDDTHTQTVIFGEGDGADGVSVENFSGACLVPNEEKRRVVFRQTLS